MDFRLTEEQLMIKAAARDFAQSEIAPIAAEFDASGEFPVDTIRQMGELGLMAGGLPLVERIGLAAVIVAPTVVLWTTHSRRATAWMTIAVGSTIVLWASLRNVFWKVSSPAH